MSIGRIASSALIHHLSLAKPPPAKGFGSAGKRTEAQAAAAKAYVEKTLQSVNGATDITIFTDGSALGNPGPSGAGAFIFYSESWRRDNEHISVPLGQGTNNIGELFAIGAAFKCLGDVMDANPNLTYGSIC